MARSHQISPPSWFTITKGMRRRKMISYNFKRQKKCQTKATKPQCDWSDLPTDIVRLIMAKQGWSDRLRLSRVCKFWNEHLNINEYEIKPDDTLPWLMFYDWQATHDGRVRSVCRLRDPSVWRTFLVEEATSPAASEDRHILVGAKPCASRYGWVLFTKVIEESCLCCCNLFFLYSPFTNEIVRLPELGMDHCKASFSLSPSSPDCVVFVVSSCKELGTDIATCRPGDKAWKKHMQHRPGAYGSVLDVNYAGDLFYCAFADGKLCAFDIRNQNWEQLSDQGPNSNNIEAAVSVASSKDYILGWKSECLWKFWKFDLSQNQWIVDNYKEQTSMILTGSTSFAVPALAKVYYFLQSFFTWHKGRLTVRWCRYIYDDSKREDKVYEWISLDEHDMKRIWIEPPLERVWKACDLLESSSEPTVQEK